MIYAIRTTSGREDIVADMIYNNVKMNNFDIKSIIHPQELDGYVFIEGNIDEIVKAIRGIIHIKKLIEKPVDISEIQRFFEKKKVSIVVKEGDIVEIIGGPFKGEKGRVQRVDEGKSEVTVELLEASILIPVTISTELVKLIKKSEESGKEG
jgi:transcriptional antiterminator NusG